MKQTIERLLDKVEWVSIERPPIEPLYHDLPYATHAGVLNLGGVSLKVFRLSNGRRVIDQQSLKELLGGAW